MNITNSCSLLMLSFVLINLEGLFAYENGTHYPRHTHHDHDNINNNPSRRLDKDGDGLQEITNS